MSKIYTGRDGSLRIGANKTEVAKVVSFQLSANVETLETTTLGDNLRSYTPGVAAYSGTATLLYYKDTGPSTPVFNTTNFLDKIFKAGTDGVSSSDTVQLTFRWIDGSDNNDITLTAYITSASMGAATGDIVRAEIAFQGTTDSNNKVLSAVDIS